MKSVLIKAPSTTDIEALPEQIVAAINSVGGQWRWVGKEVADFGLLDCVVTDDFEPAMLGIVPDWTLLAMWQWDGQPYTGAANVAGIVIPEQHPCTVLMPVAAETIQFLPDHVTYNPDGSEASRTAPTEWYEAMRWAGWPVRMPE